MFGPRIGDVDRLPSSQKPMTDAILVERQSTRRILTAQNARESPAADLAPPIPRSKDVPNTSTCTCGCHSSPLPHQSRSIYANASTQTDRLPSPPRTALRIDTSKPAYWPSQHGYSAISQDAYYNDPQQDYDTPSVFMGRIMNYFSEPGYQLGDSLFSGYQPINWQHTTYEYQDEFGEEALR
jgi:hypothetical protein